MEVPPKSGELRVGERHHENVSVRVQMNVWQLHVGSERANTIVVTSTARNGIAKSGDHYLIVLRVGKMIKLEKDKVGPASSSVDTSRLVESEAVVERCLKLIIG
jgi:hypothetical protein